MNTKYVPGFAQRTKSTIHAREKMTLRTLYQQYLRDTRDTDKTKTGTVRGKIYTAEM